MNHPTHDNLFFIAPRRSALASPCYRGRLSAILLIQCQEKKRYRLFGANSRIICSLIAVSRTVVFVICTVGYSTADGIPELLMGECGASRFWLPSDQALLALLVGRSSQPAITNYLIRSRKAETPDSNLLVEALCDKSCATFNDANRSSIPATS
jgi:hypothetical protein